MASETIAQTGGDHARLITAPETHQRHPAPALCLLSKLPAKGGSIPALHLVSFYGNRKHLLVGDGKAEVKGAGGGGEGTIHNFNSSPKAVVQAGIGKRYTKSQGILRMLGPPLRQFLGPAHLWMQPTRVLGQFFQLDGISHSLK